jgi:group I intron endonuclease
VIAYLVTNIVNGKRYIGITSKTLKRRWGYHLRGSTKDPHGILGRAIAKHGSGRFRVEEIACARDWDDLCAVEVELIKQYRTKSPCGYNLTDGGEGAYGKKLPQKQIDALRALSTGRKHTEEAKRKIGIASRGRKMPPSQGVKISQSRKGKRFSDEHRKKLSLAKIGRKRPVRSQEHSAKISEGLKRSWARRKAA